MSLGKPSYYLAALLDSTEARSLYGRLVLERDHPERKLLIPRMRRKGGPARRHFCVIEMLVSSSKDADGDADRMARAATDSGQLAADPERSELDSDS